VLIFAKALGEDIRRCFEPRELYCETLQAVCHHGLAVAGVTQLDREMRGGSVWVFCAIESSCTVGLSPKSGSLAFYKFGRSKTSGTSCDRSVAFAVPSCKMTMMIYYVAR
jgi:hypothetical protein